MTKKRLIALGISMALGLVVFSAPVFGSHEGNTDSRIQIVGSESTCGLTKDFTWDQSFRQGGAPKFRDVTIGNATRAGHNEPHTGPGVPGMSWITPAGVTIGMSIFGGSQWTGPCDQSGYDYEGDAVKYAVNNFNGRYENQWDGHSGLVVIVGSTDDQCILIDAMFGAGDSIPEERTLLTQLILEDQREHMQGTPLCATLSASNAQGHILGGVS